MYLMFFPSWSELCYLLNLHHSCLLTVICHFPHFPWHHCFQPTRWLTSALFSWHEPDESQLSKIFWYQPESNITVCSFAFDTLDESRQSRAVVFWSDCCLCVFVSVWVYILMCLERRLLWKGDLSSCAGDCGWWVVAAAMPLHRAVLWNGATSQGCGSDMSFLSPWGFMVALDLDGPPESVFPGFLQQVKWLKLPERSKEKS